MPDTVSDGEKGLCGLIRQGMRGALAQYADPALAKRETGAWERAAVEKHDPA